MEHDGAAMYVKSSFLLTSVACGSEHTTWLAMHTLILVVGEADSVMG